MRLANIFLGVGMATGLLLQAAATAIRPGEFPMQGRYVGVLPCDDCAGVWTELVLSDPGVNAGQGSGTFVLTERFTGGAHGGQTAVTRGDWSTIAAPPMGRDAAFSGVIELRGEPHNGLSPAPRLFDCDHGRTLALLDAEQHRVYSEGTTSLQRVIPLPARRFGPLTEAQSGAVVDVEVGDEVMLRLPAETLRDSLKAWTSARTPGAMQVYSITGSGQGKRFFTDVDLHALATGTQTITLQNASDPMRKVQFRFRVLPRSGKPETCSE